MSTSKRIISGTIASWVKILLTFIIQILLVPVYLSFWSVEVYGIWIAIQAFSSVLSIIDISHQNYLGFEFLKFGHKKVYKISRYLSSSVLVSLFVGLSQLLLLVLFLYYFDNLFFSSYEIKNVSYNYEANNSLIFLSFVWFSWFSCLIAPVS
jgi:Na+-driven multidrug efflux pump